jgi:preprotein translocase subunit SecD
MKSTWYISTLIIIFTLLGVANHQQIPAPNQEIVLQFTHLKVSSNEVQQTIALVKKQLQAIGVENIQIEEQETGSLKITYYSDTDVISVKKILSEEKTVSLENITSDENKKPTNSSSEDHSIIYNLDVFEIQKQDLETGFAGKFAIELKTEYNRFYIPNVYVSKHVIDARVVESQVKKTFKFSKNATFVKDNTSHKIPEVRAGPFC